ncbi:MAG: hypothetical protein JWQ21_623 [Herminiimonas sp.]|nr:hypothetical protein [Herminiimonas sp.]
MTFEEWMKSSGLSQSSIDKYAGAIDGPLTAWGMSYNFTLRPLREIHQFSEFEVLAQKITGTSEYVTRNKTGHHMYGAALKKYGEFLAGVEVSIGKRQYIQGPHSRQIESIEADEDLHSFSPAGQQDAREKVLREVVRRRGQPKFRSKLIDAYEAKCAITGCDVLPILEAAHITSYLGPATNMPSNGILLRADIHTLWDLGLIALDPESKTVLVNPKISDNTYQRLIGVFAFQPKVHSARASTEALNQQWKLFKAALQQKLQS